MRTIRPNCATDLGKAPALLSGTVHAEGCGMYLVPFDLKRAYLSSLSHLHRVTKPHELTPARFELLDLLGDGAMLQSAIHRALGVTRATTCRMLVSLYELGLVSRRHPPGKRNYLVQLTAEGRKRLRAVRASSTARESS